MNQKRWTIFGVAAGGLAVTIFVLLSLAFYALVAFVAVHFIRKFW